MNLVRKAFTALGGVFLAAILIAVLAPKVTLGVAAALVQVTNTSANPVPTVSADANFPYEAGFCAGSVCTVSQSSFSVPATTTTGVPVKRLVIEDLNANCDVTAPESNFFELFVPASADAKDPEPLRHLFVLTDQLGSISAAHEIVRLYADPLATVSAISSSEHCVVILTGHLETK
jgi:hypothetical protein